MRKNLKLILLIAASLIFVTAGRGFSQEQNVQQESGTPANVQAGSETQWVWGEVASLDTENKIIVVKYLDYETDQEKEISIGVNDLTTFENIKSLDEIKPQDAVSIDYTVSPDGKNIAKNMSLEKPESQPMPSQSKPSNPEAEVAPESKTGDTNVEAVPQEAQPPMPKEQQ